LAFYLKMAGAVRRLQLVSEEEGDATEPPPPPGALAAVAACSVSLNGELIHPSSVFNYECEGGKEVTVELEIANAGTNDQVIKTSMLPRDEASAQAFQFLTKAGTVTGGTDIESKVRAGGRHCPQGITMQV
jgi:hypothetical protein